LSHAEEGIAEKGVLYLAETPISLCYRQQLSTRLFVPFSNLGVLRAKIGVWSNRAGVSV